MSQHMDYNEGYRREQYQNPESETTYQSDSDYRRPGAGYQQYEQPAMSSFQAPMGKVTPQSKESSATTMRFVLAIISLGIMIPLAAISLTTTGLPALIVVGAIIIAINFAFAFGHNRF